MKIHRIALCSAVSVLCLLGAGCGASSEPAGYDDPHLVQDREKYRSTAAAEHVEFSGVAADLRAALLHPDMLVRVERLGGLLQKLGPESAQQVLDTYETVWMELGQTELIMLGDWWARFDPHAALEWAESDFRTAGTNTPLAVMRSWARYDHNAAIARARLGKKGDKESRNGYETSALEGWAESGKPGMMDYVQGLGPSIHGQRTLRGITRRKVMRDGVDAAFAWADALSDQDKLFKLNVLRRVATNAALVDPDSAARHAAKYDGTYYMKSLPQRIAMHWVKRDPMATMAWLRSLKPSADRDNGVLEGFREWIRHDKEAALAWVSEDQRHEAWKDEALALYARRLQITDPKKAIALSENIVDESLRVSTLLLIARSWKVQDPEQAIAWMEEESGLTPAERERAQVVSPQFRQSVVVAMERAQGRDEATAKARLEDWSDRDENASDGEAARRLRELPNPLME